MTKKRRKRSSHEGLKVARLLMVLSSISPLFILWAIRGDTCIPDEYFIGFCATMVILPNLFLWLRIRLAVKLADKRELVVGTAEDHRDHVLVYLFAMLLPFYSESLTNWRELAAAFAAISFIVFLFWHLNLHYMNLLFAVFGYRVFTVYPPSDHNPLGSKGRVAIISRRVSLLPGESVFAYRISNTVYLETSR